MEFYHLQELFEAVRHYSLIGAMMADGCAPNVVQNDVARLHEAMAKVDMGSVVAVLEQHCANERAMENCVRQWLDNDLKLLIERMDGNRGAFSRADEHKALVFRFAADMADVLHEAEARVGERLEAERIARDNENVLEVFDDFNAGCYGGMSLRDFLARHITNDAPQSVAVRRLEHLSHHCDLDQRMTIGNVIEEMKKATWPERPESNQPPTRETQTPQPTLSVQATTKGNDALPDFSHMESFAPTIKFDMSALYRFLIDWEVIKDIDERLFANCIEHAHINELWNDGHVAKKGKQGKRNLLQCLFKMLAGHYPNEWIAKCAENMGERVTRTMITNPTKSGKTTVFEDKLRRILKGKVAD